MATPATDRTAVKLQYQVCPIILTAGVAEQIPGGVLPMLALFGNMQQGQLGALQAFPFGTNDLDDAFGAFNILPGGTLVSQSIAKYPFANQSVAANAVIREPLTLSLIMDAPMRGPNAFQVKRALFDSLKSTLDYHNNAGGTYTVVTPAYMFQNLIMTALTDNSRGNNSLPQNAWRFDFEKPLVALADLIESLNLLNAKLTNQVPVLPNLSGIQVGTDVAQSSQQTSGVPLPTSTPDLSSTGVPLPSPMASVFGNLSSGIPTIFPNPTFPGISAVRTGGGFPFSGVS